MMDATEARARLTALKTLDKENRQKKAMEFVETVCGQHIEDAVENRHSSVTVAVPDKMYAEDCANKLREMGYVIHITYGNPDKLNISW